MGVVENKDKAQREALNLWVAANCNGTIEAATAFGKSRLGVLAISHFAKKANYEFKALIVTPTTAIQDEWRKEFKKWGENRVLIECVEIYCINTAREFKQEVYDILVADRFCSHKILLIDWEPFRALHTPYFRNESSIVKEVKIRKSAAKLRMGERSTTIPQGSTKLNSY